MTEWEARDILRIAPMIEREWIHARPIYPRMWSERAEWLRLVALARMTLMAAPEGHLDTQGYGS